MVYYCFAYTLQQAHALGRLVLIMFNAPAIPSGQNPVHEWDDCKAIPSFSGARISSSEYLVRSGEAGRSRSTEVGQGSISLEAGELPVAQKAPLEQGTSPAQHVHFRKLRCNAVCCRHTDSSAGHLPHLLGNVKPALWRHCWWYGIM